MCVCVCVKIKNCRKQMLLWIRVSQTALGNNEKIKMCTHKTLQFYHHVCAAWNMEITNWIAKSACIIIDEQLKSLLKLVISQRMLWSCRRCLRDTGVLGGKYSLPGRRMQKKMLYTAVQSFWVGKSFFERSSHQVCIYLNKK